MGAAESSSVVQARPYAVSARSHGRPPVSSRGGHPRDAMRLPGNDRGDTKLHVTREEQRQPVRAAPRSVPLPAHTNDVAIARVETAYRVPRTDVALVQGGGVFVQYALPAYLDLRGSQLVTATSFDLGKALSPPIRGADSFLALMLHAQHEFLVATQRREGEQREAQEERVSRREERAAQQALAIYLVYGAPHERQAKHTRIVEQMMYANALADVAERRRRELHELDLRWVN